MIHTLALKIGAYMSLTIHKDLRIQIASHVTDPKDLIALGGTDKAWRVVVSAVLRTRLKTYIWN